MADLAKIVEDLSALTVLEAAELSKMLEEKWGVSAAAPVAVAAAGGAAPAAAEEEKTEFDVILTDAGANKINVIKEVAPSPVSASRKPRTSSKALRRLSRKPFPRLKPLTSRRSLKTPAPRSTLSNIGMRREKVSFSRRFPPDTLPRDRMKTVPG